MKVGYGATAAVAASSSESDRTALTSFLPFFSFRVALDYQGPTGR
jgi:hypothetical protein